MNASSVVTAALPVPVTLLHLIPTYAAQTGYLSVYTPVFCFLLFGFVFYNRLVFAKWAFRPSGRKPWQGAVLMALPATFIAISLALVIYYHSALQLSITDLNARGVRASTETILRKTDYMDIPRSGRLSFFYIGMFLSIEAAFALMALREYLQDLFGLSDSDLISAERSQRHPGSNPTQPGDNLVPQIRSSSREGLNPA